MEQFTAEMIEQYLEGKLAENERLKMEAAMSQHAELKEEVLVQQVLVKKIEEQALRTLIQEAHLRHLKSRGFSSDFLIKNKWIIAVVLSAIVLFGLIFFFSDSKQETNTKEAGKSSHIQQTDGVNVDAGTPLIEGASDGAIEQTDGLLPEVPFMVYTFLAEKGVVIKDSRSGAIIKVPASILTNREGTLVKGKVTLKYREFRTQADMALAGIPMTYKEYNFNSAGMFEIYTLQQNDTLGIKKDGAIAIDFVMTNNDAGNGFYKLNDKTNQWEFMHSLNKDSQGKKFYFSEVYNGFQSTVKDQFIRSLGYQKAVLDGKNKIPELPAKQKGDFNTLYNNKIYKQIAGSDTNTLNRISITEVDDDMVGGGGGGSGFFNFFKRMFFSSGSVVIPLKNQETKKVDTNLIILVGDKKYTILENGKNIVMSELSALGGTQFIYDGQDIFSNLSAMTFYDVRIKRDTTVLNRFVLELKTDGRILKYRLRLNKTDFTSYAEYDQQQRMRMLMYDNRVKLKEKEYQDLVQLRNERKEMLDSVSLYGNENIFRMARLIMTDDELKMSQEEWFASLDTNRNLRKRIDAQLDSIEAYGDNADTYIEKLAAERKQNLREERLNQKLNQQLFPANVDAGHYFNPFVANLKIDGFGIYNCDGVYLIKNPVSIKGNYLTEDSVQISKLKAISLIDPKVNGAFSFNPALFTCSASTDNMILLFTTDGKIYFFDKTKWKTKQIKRSGPVTFYMTDITTQVKKSSDLQRILEGSLL